MRVVLGVTGGIAAYKAVFVLRLLREAGHRVRVVPTEAALRMVGRPTWEALSGEPVRTSVFDDAEHVDHVALGRGADLVIVAPATANLLAKAAAGLADDLLTATLLTVTCPVLLAPAMHTEMWQHPATRANVATLRSRGVHVLEPDSGRLTGADTGPGRLPEPATIVEAALGLLGHVTGAAPSAASPATPVPAGPDLAGRTVVVSAGGTREPLDPVRFLGNRSSGRQGVALAVAAAHRGARVTLVAANVEDVILPREANVEVHQVETTLQLRDAVRAAATGADVVIMAAAVADFRPVASAGHKIKKTSGAPAPIELVTNPDILAELAADRLRRGQVVVGFAAETGDGQRGVLEHGREKARRKGADLLAVNEVGADLGFGDVPNEVTVLDAAGDVVARARGTKGDVAEALLDAVADRLRATTTIDR
ncbi:bifunctional phosphopantothenoylcysteine decarboxylase/phosphopantothenate--cysteine ligase CoaBC [Georgenia yuyongxinii]|uniref:Coenzyme A biosynthesis bifunctional protein CoaBC n=1 Tax=Georgenia yuyongxinii TaxID=2589797 RepID=A0A552WVM3_9MICO|nr:bifunctional phosphopantothenoylcysteine decarboxylase/phosphopantothenate--cysteine ligase CoaBC [Georgenia yuyongxinii]TRW46891.1 bifunctional phosphopantothenoylcysteine decarboxylase/phosphopantothenate--cysteine ligase CoaBC [Georgenia yuyongxinii]